jgi:hypothetical protein
VLDRLVRGSSAARRRVDYYALREVRLLGELLPLALDPGVEMIDTTAESLLVHIERSDRTDVVWDCRKSAESALAAGSQRRTNHYNEVNQPHTASSPDHSCCGVGETVSVIDRFLGK